MFALYRIEPQRRICQFEKEVHLARLFCDQVTLEAAKGNVLPNRHMPWEIGGAELRDRAVQSHLGERAVSPVDYKLVIDVVFTTPYAQLFEISHVWGYAGSDWTPLLLQLRLLHEDNRPNGEGTEVDRFELRQELENSTDFVHEFLYLQWGYEGRKQRSWGRVGYTNGTLLYAPGLDHLLGKIGYRRAQS